MLQSCRSKLAVRNASNGSGLSNLMLWAAVCLKCMGHRVSGVCIGTSDNANGRSLCVSGRNLCRAMPGPLFVRHVLEGHFRRRGSVRHIHVPKIPCRKLERQTCELAMPQFAWSYHLGLPLNRNPAYGPFG
jgi:hypothetical protein